LISPFFALLVEEAVGPALDLVLTIVVVLVVVVAAQAAWPVGTTLPL
jgi:hypothetical protein